MARRSRPVQARLAHTGNIESVGPAPAAGVATAVTATTAMVGVLVMAAVGPATADALPSLILTSSESSLQPVIDQILAEQQAAVTADSSLPWATSSNNAMLPAMLQNQALQNLMLTLTQQSEGSPLLYQPPEIVAGDAANNRFYFGGNNPDNIYRSGNLDPNATYILNGHIGAGSQDLTINAYQLNITQPDLSGPGLELGSTLQVNPDGSYSVTIGPTTPTSGGNYIDDTGYNGVFIRDTMGNWALGPGSTNIECTADCPAVPPGITSTGLSSGEISSLLNTLASVTTANNDLTQNVYAAVFSKVPVNTVPPFHASTALGGLATQAIAGGRFDLEPGQALIVKVPDVDAAYGGIQLTNSSMFPLPSVLAQSSLNDSQAFHDPDGYTYYVISATNPGVANWLDTSGIDLGDIIARFQDIAAGADVADLPVTSQLVPVADVSKYLPTDTPTVSPEQFAADMNERVLGYDYALDTSRLSSQPSWVTEQVWLHDLQTAMGSNNFDAVFGEQVSTPMWLRLTPALSPDMFTVLKDFLADPSASMTAIQDNLALAEKDISLPIQLAETLLQKDPNSFFSVLNEALFDPNTSIIAGILNARDDLATAIMAATNNGFPTQLGPIATWEWEHMSELTQMTPTTMASDLGTLLNPSDFLGT